ncbi:MAG: RIP metalloprotease RseP [Verrucomicrobiota bacterium]|jgi:regulator of sigma E protease
MSEFLNWFYVIAAMLLLFGAAVFVHEFGHYWMARRRGLKVEAFAIGFGPKIFGWTRDGIEYSWRWIPAGGFVKLPQMITSEALEGSRGPDEEKIPPASPWSKILVAFAGPFMNVVFAFAIATVIYFVGLPVLVNPSIVGFVDPQSEEAKLGIREGDKIVEVNGKKVKSWQDVQMTTILARTNVLPVVVERDGKRQTFHLTAKVNATLGWKMLNLEPRDHPEVLEVLRGGAGDKAGLQAKDVVLSFASVPIASKDQLIGLIEKRPGETTEMVVDRNGQKVALAVTPVLTNGKGRIGVVLGNNSANVYQVERPGPTPVAQIVDVWDKTISTLSALFHSKQTGVGVKDLSGPPGILAMLAAQINTDYRLALSFLVLLNINLAILNLLPIPVLDGGHILMALIEKIRRRPLSVKFVEYTTTGFAVLLISFMLYVSFNDIKRFRFFRLMFEGKNRIEEQQSVPAEAPASAPAQSPVQ